MVSPQMLAPAAAVLLLLSSSSSSLIDIKKGNVKVKVVFSKIFCKR